MPEASVFWDRTADVYDDAIDGVFANDLRALMRERLEREPDLGRTVEFGCGTGYYTPVLAARSSGGVVATDISEKMLDRLRERIRGMPAITGEYADCEQTSFPDASFDTAFFGLSFHFVDGARTLAEMHRILRPGGQLILAVPTMEGLSFPQKLRGIVRNFRAFGTPISPGSRLYTRESVGSLLIGAGFRPAETDLVTDPAHPGGFSCIWVRALR